MSLPPLFAAGMSLMDTADGASMTRSYGWVFSSPLRKVRHNLVVTALSIVMAAGVGTVEVAQLAGGELHLGAGVWSVVRGLDFEQLGTFIVTLLVATWACSYVIWTARRLDRRWEGLLRRGG